MIYVIKIVSAHTGLFYCVDSHHKILYYKTVGERWQRARLLRGVIPNLTTVEVIEQFNTMEEFLTKYFEDLI